MDQSEIYRSQSQLYGNYKAPFLNYQILNKA